MKTKRDYVAQGELSSAPEPVKKKIRWYSIVFETVALLVIVAVIAVSANAIYLSSAYNMPFFVNGMSMYPTLNADGTSASGTPLKWNHGANVAGDVIDYGFAKTGDKDNWRDGLKRYDIVVAYYPSDYLRDSKGDYVLDKDGKKQLLPSADAKIKRIIGMPGETVHLTYIDVENRVWGKTTINPGTETEEVLKPLYTEADYAPVNGHVYNYQRLRSKGEYTWNLGKDEYVVLGDNRAYSTDCFDGAKSFSLSSDMIIGKAYLVIGQRRLDNDLNPVNDWSYVFTPWKYRRIG